jgi:hypothetical protein
MAQSDATPALLRIDAKPIPLCIRNITRPSVANREAAQQKATTNGGAALSREKACHEHVLSPQ